ncbi:hypothetical protein Q73_13470 [Bacillus coahuilensis m2-6]|nr:hypothetical protein Q73_13470 [Bacillus coahuilensis m2-6]
MAEDVLQFFGDEFIEGSLVLIILLCCSIFRALQELFSKILVAVGLAKFSYYSSIYSGILNIVLNYIFIINYGLIGAAIATVLSVLINFVLCYIYFVIKTELFISFKMILVNIYTSLIMVFILLILKMF